MNMLLFAIWFFLPAGVANAAPIIAAKTPLLRQWNTPLDFGKELRGTRVFGDHKTWRGLCIGILTAIAAVYVQRYVVMNSSFGFLDGQPISYLVDHPVITGFLFGFGALAGDAAKSFFKRRHRVEAGKSWYPFDQIDYVLGACIATAAIVVLQPMEYVSIIVVWFLLHLLFSYIGYWIKLKEAPI